MLYDCVFIVKMRVCTVGERESVLSECSVHFLKPAVEPHVKKIWQTASSSASSYNIGSYLKPELKASEELPSFRPFTRPREMKNFIQGKFNFTFVPLPCSL